MNLYAYECAAVEGNMPQMKVLPRVPNDYGFNGFFDVRDPYALFKKLRYDYDRMISDPLNAYPAFDFFVTANHLVDWIWPSATRKQHRDIRTEEVIPRICEHLANGAKHFILNRKHNAVAQLESVEAPKVAIDEALADREVIMLASIDPEDGLYVTIEPAEATELGAERLTSIHLARRVLTYWGGRIG